LLSSFIDFIHAIATPFERHSSAAEVVEGIDLSGKWAIVTGAASGIGGRYFEDCNEATIVANGNGYRSGVAPYALNPDNADRLWEESLRLIA
jgi:hypothetical protein